MATDLVTDLAGVAIIVALALLGAQAYRLSEPKPARAPKWSARTHKGQTVSSASLLGTKYIIFFYPKADTGG